MIKLKNITAKLGDKKKLRIIFILLVLITSTLIYTFYNNHDNVKIYKDPTKQASIYNTYNSEEKENSVSKETELPEKLDNKSENKIVENIYVDVGGAVMSPQVVCIPESSRVFEAIAAAGGISTDADTKYLNMAAVCNDGEKLYIPTITEIQNGDYNNLDKATEKPNLVKNSNLQDLNGSSAGTVNINTANSSELQTLSGIGPSMAERIIEYREQNGKFSSIEDLKKVSGIGEKKFSSLKEEICI